MHPELCDSPGSDAAAPFRTSFGGLAAAALLICSICRPASGDQSDAPVAPAAPRPARIGFIPTAFTLDQFEFEAEGIVRLDTPQSSLLRLSFGMFDWLTAEVVFEPAYWSWDDFVVNPSIKGRILKTDDWAFAATLGYLTWPESLGNPTWRVQATYLAAVSTWAFVDDRLVVNVPVAAWIDNHTCFDCQFDYFYGPPNVNPHSVFRNKNVGVAPSFQATPLRFDFGLDVSLAGEILVGVKYETESLLSQRFFMI
jgi:hypothetical protein